MPMLDCTGIFYMRPKPNDLAQREAPINNKSLTSDKKIKGVA